MNYFYYLCYFSLFSVSLLRYHNVQTYFSSSTVWKWTNGLGSSFTADLSCVLPSPRSPPAARRDPLISLYSLGLHHSPFPSFQITRILQEPCLQVSNPAYLQSVFCTAGKALFWNINVLNSLPKSKPSNDFPSLEKCKLPSMGCQDPRHHIMKLHTFLQLLVFTKPLLSYRLSSCHQEVPSVPQAEPSFHAPLCSHFSPSRFRPH